MAICLTLFVSGYLKASDESSFFVSTGFHKGFFDTPLRLIPEIRIIEYNFATFSPNWQTPLGPGNVSFGLDIGYSSGSRFGGSGSVDFLPITFRTSYLLPLGENFRIGPVAKVGGFGMISPNWSRWELFAGGRIEAEIQLPIVAAGIYVAGGFDAYPTALEPVAVPAFEVGLRFPRGRTRLPERRVRTRPEPVIVSQVIQEEVAELEAEEEAVVIVEKEPEPVEEILILVLEPEPEPKEEEVLVLEVLEEAEPEEPAYLVQVPLEEPEPEIIQETVKEPVEEPLQVVQLPTELPTELPKELPVEEPKEPVTVVAEEPVRQEERPVIPRPDPRSRPVIYFEPDTAVMLENSRSTLDEIGRQMAADPSLRLLMFAYAAPFKTSDGRFMVSVNRGRVSRDYLIRQHGIASSRIDFEAWGSDRRPEQARDGQWETFRCVEFALFAVGATRPSIAGTSRGSINDTS
jgi:outer membrane protein OmpA-like peptidoglycan-associated protein